MRRYWFTVAILGSLFAAGCSSRSGRPQAAVYPKTRVLQCSCASAWRESLSAIADAGFRLVAKDDAGQIARFLYLEPLLPEVVRNASDPDNLAVASDGSAQESGRLRIESAVLALSPHQKGCEVKISVSYQGQTGVWGRSWSSLESSGLLESRVLSELTPASRQRGSRTKVATAARFSPDTRGVVTSPDAPAYDLARQ